MKEFDDWEIDDIMYLYEIIDSAHKAKNAKKLSQILDEVSDLRELLGKIHIEKIQNLLKILSDLVVNRTDDTNDSIGDQENT